MVARSDRATVEALKQAIVTAAIRRFAKAGVHATSINAIAKDVGISKQALMHHYPSKQRLRDAVNERLAQQMGPLVPRLLMAVSQQDRLEAVIHELVDFFTDRADYARYLLRDALDASEADSYNAFGAWVKLAADFIRAEQQAGKIPHDVDPEAAIAQIGLMLLTTFAMPMRATDFAGERVEAEAWRTRMITECRRILTSAFRM